MPTMTTQEDLARRALDVPRAVDLNVLADVAERTRSSMDAYREGRAPMPPDVRLKVAAYLDAHARKLTGLAEELTESAAKPEGER